MITKNYQANHTGKLVASGAGAATLTANSICQWAIGDSAVTAPSLTIRHVLPFGENVSLDLVSGEHLWVFGVEIVAVTAEVPAAGEV